MIKVPDIKTTIPKNPVVNVLLLKMSAAASADIPIKAIIINKMFRVLFFI